MSGHAQNMKVKLNSGDEMPLVGFGTFRIQGKALIRNCLDYALAAGYRQIDTAAVYGNEKDIGIALKELLPKYNLKRKDIFITSKLSPSNHGDRAFTALQTSVKNIDCDYLDLYLIHWPGAHGISGNHPDNPKLRTASWVSLMEGIETGIVKNIGVSNYTVHHLSELLSRKYKVKPSVNQVEWHPHCYDNDLKQFCINEGILLQAYSSLGGSDNHKLISDPVVTTVASKLQKSPAQVLLRWAFQQGIGIIPKARTKQHIENNFKLDFEIPDNYMNELYNLKTQERYAWNPNVIV